MDLIAELAFDLSYSEEQMGLRIFRPTQRAENGTWSCAFEIDEPIDIRREIYGESSVQALVLALKTLSAYLYGSKLYKRGELGLYGIFGGNLSIPAPQIFLDVAPYPF